MVRRRDGTVTEDGVEMAETMLDEHFPESSPDENVNSGTQRKVIAPHYDWLSEKAFTAAVKKFGNNKAPGPDEIKPIVLKKLPAIWKAAANLRSLPGFGLCAHGMEKVQSHLYP
jgi:hypothetical protein